jgi:hypothetical protein
MADVLLRADMVNTTFISPDELIRYINQGITELYEDLCVASQDYYLSQWTVNTTNGTDTYPLPADFFWIRGIDINLGGQQYFPARRFNWEERDAYKLQGTGWYWDQPVWYDLRGPNIVVLPAPQGVYQLIGWYYPTAPSLNGPDDTFDSVNGWDELIVLSAAIKCLTKEESWEAVDRLTAAYDRQKMRVQSMAPKRNAGQPPRITDVFRGRTPYRRRIS